MLLAEGGIISVRVVNAQTKCDLLTPVNCPALTEECGKWKSFGICAAYMDAQKNLDRQQSSINGMHTDKMGTMKVTL